MHQLGESPEQIKGRGASLEKIEGRSDEETNGSRWREGERGRERGRVVEDQLPSTPKGEARPRGEGDGDGPVEVAYAREG
jgi:hypothetical protein